MVSAILSEWPDPNPIDEEDVVDLVGLGTVADVVPLKGKNRSPVRKGLRQMRQPRRPGLVALINVPDLNTGRISALDIGFKLGPHLTLRADQEQAFVERVSAYAMQTLTDEMLIRTSIADAEIPLSGLNMDLVKMLDLVEPTGMENPGPRFVVRGALVLSHRTVGKDAAHLKLSLGDGRCKVDGIGFGLGHLNQELPAIVDVLFSPSLNEYNGNITVQMMIDDIIPSVPVAPAAGNGKRSIRVESEEDF